jgi:hypothetical protein
LLYDVEREARDGKLDGEARGALRQEKSKPILEDIHAYLEQEQPRVLPKSPEGEAIAYTLSNWQALTRFCDDGNLAIDNNGAYAARGISTGMPTSGLCRHLNRGSRSTDVQTTCNRHNQRPSRKARRRSGG